MLTLWADRDNYAWVNGKVRDTLAVEEHVVSGATKVGAFAVDVVVTE